MSEWKNDNPLLFTGGLPPFDEVKAEHVVPAVESLIAELEAELEALEENVGPHWEESVVPIELMGDRLGRCWGVVGHLMGVRNEEALREAYEAAQPVVVQFSLRLGQSENIHRALLELSESEEAKALSGAQQRILESLLREAKHSGVALAGESRERFNGIAQELAQLSTDFSNRVLDATEAGGLWLREKADVAGLPQSLLELTAQSARDAGESEASAESGPWKLGLDPTSVMPFLQHSTRRDLREAIYRAYVGRAGDGEFDNREAIERILVLRQEQAALLGYGSYAELSLSGKMASDVAAVLGLLEELRTPSFGEARAELGTLTDFARGQGFEEEALSLWDVPYWAERMREDQFDYSEETLRAYFPFAQVLEGLFGLAQRLFHVRIEPADGEAPIWHEDVRFFRV